MRKKENTCSKIFIFFSNKSIIYLGYIFEIETFTKYNRL